MNAREWRLVLFAFQPRIVVMFHQLSENRSIMAAE